MPLKKIRNQYYKEMILKSLNKFLLTYHKSSLIYEGKSTVQWNSVVNEHSVITYIILSQIGHWPF